MVDFLRLHLNPIKGIFIILFGSFLRKREFSSLTGGSYLLLASLATILIFDDPGVFIAAIAFLAVGDTVAAIVGLSVGKIKVFRKSLECSLAGFLSCLLVAYIVAILPDKSLPLRITFWGAVAATLVEALPIEVNDNVVVPILSATVMQLVKTLT